MSNDLKQTAFYAAQAAAGATWTDWEGWSWAADFGDPVAEHIAVRTACEVWDESALRKWVITGPDALRLTDIVFANDMSQLEVGQARYGAICDENGMMLMDGTVFKYADDHCLSITSYDSDLAWFRKVASDRGLDVQVEDKTAELPHLQLQGPLARDVLASITEGTDIGALRYFRFLPRDVYSDDDITVGGVPVMIARTGYSGELGYELYCRPADADKLWDVVITAGKPHGILPIGLSAIETIRIESGLLFPDVDYFQGETDPFEVRLDGVTKPDKQADFIGKEALQRIAAAGTPRLLTTLRIAGDLVPEYGAPVALGGKEVGIVRSPCKSPTFDMEVLAMAAIDRELSVPGQKLEVPVEGGTATAVVDVLPLYDSEKKRPRV